MPQEFPIGKARKGILSRLVFVPEWDSWDADPATVNPIVQQLAERAEDGVGINQPFEDAPVYTGDTMPPDVVDMNFNAEVSYTLATEFRALAQNFALYFGRHGYFNLGGGWHRYMLPVGNDAEPISLQALATYLQGTSQFERSTGNIIGSLAFPFQTAGRAQYTLGLMGSGNYLKTSIGGAPVDHGYKPASYFNYRAIIDDKVVGGLRNLTINMAQGAERIDVGGRDGKAGTISTGYHTAEGDIAMLYTVAGSGIEANNNFQSLWETKKKFVIECIYADAPFGISKEFHRFRFFVRIEKPRKSLGGASVAEQSARWKMVRSSDATEANWGAEILAKQTGPFTIPADGKLGVKIAGGATIPVTLTAGAGKTSADLATDLNANVTFAAGAVADVLCGRLHIVSLATGSTASLQIDTGQVDSVHALLGLDGTIYTGVSRMPLIIDTLSTLTADLIPALL